MDPAVHDAPEMIPSDRPSERPTLPTLPPLEDPSSPSVTELSESDFVDDELALPANAATLKPPPNPRGARRSWLGTALRISAGALLLVTAIFVLLDAPAPSGAREPRVAWPDRTTSIAPASAASPAPPPHGCVATSGPRFVAPRSLVNPGLDVSTSETGFVVALAAASDEASAVRLEGTALRAAENVRLRTNAPVRRVVAVALTRSGRCRFRRRIAASTPFASRRATRAGRSRGPSARPARASGR